MDYRPRLDDYFGEKAEIYEKRAGLKKIKASATKMALEFLDLPNKSKILDVGCGTGWSTETITQAGHNVTGIDISDDMLYFARKKGFDVRKADMRDIRIFSNETFDAIISISALHFIAEKLNDRTEIRKNYKKAANEIYRVLKADGKGVIEYFPATMDELKISLKEFGDAGFDGGLFIENVGRRKEQKFLLIYK